MPVTERLQELVAAVLVRILERRYERFTRAWLADLAEARRRLARHFRVLVLHELDERFGPLRIGVLRQDRRHQLPHGRAVVAGHAGQLVQAHELHDVVGGRTRRHRPGVAPWKG